MSDDSDSERVEIRKELSQLTFEQLIELKQKVGQKVFNETVKGKKKPQNVEFTRTHKKRPREMSSKIPVDTFRKVVPETHLKVNAPRDPRFDSSCGEFNEAKFNKAYSFVNDIKAKEKGKLHSLLQTEKDADRKKEIKFLIQRMENKEREEARKLARNEVENAERLSRKQAVKDGKKAHYYKKSEKTLIGLVDSFEELKKSGKLVKHIERKIKTRKAKDRKTHSLRKEI